LRNPGAKKLFLPVLGLLAAAVVLLALLTVTTYLNLDREAKQAERILAARGATIVSGLAAGLRTGWRFWDWPQESLEGLIQEMSQGEDVAFITLLDDLGIVIGHSNPDLTGKVLQDYHKIVSLLQTDKAVGWFEGRELYLSGRRLSAREGMGRMERMMRPNRRSVMLLQPSVILVGLKTDTYLSSRSAQINRALLMGGLFFVIGIGAIYLIFVLQNYRTIDKTLSDLSTYTSGIVDNMPNGLISLDGDGRPVMINRAARTMFGFGEKSEKHLRNHPVLQALAKEFLKDLDSGQQILEREFSVTAEDGQSIPLAVSAAVVQAGVEGTEGQGAIFILRDLRQIRDLEEQVRQSEKLAAVGRLAAGVAHEVRNPLSSMRGLARFLARDMDEASREAEYLKVMVGEIDRINRVVTGLLDFARPPRPKLSSVDINDLVRHTLGLVTDDARHQGVDIHEELSENSLTALADRDQAIQAVLNVLLNGIEAMPDGGLLKVRTYTDSGQAVISIEDTGPGVEPKDRSRLFDPFYSTKKSGTGLGLALVARIMEAHHGRVVVGGQAGQGSVFTLYFHQPDTELEEEA
jgi:two-component system sensor histidine kinase HydH